MTREGRYTQKVDSRFMVCGGGVLQALDNNAKISHIQSHITLRN